LNGNTITVTRTLFSRLSISAILTLKSTFILPPQDILDSNFLKLININFDQTTKSVISSIPLKEIASLVHQETVASVNKKKAPSSTKAGVSQRKDFEVPAKPQ
jgi:hypothetical protein